jgi:hypothetical protein
MEQYPRYFLTRSVKLGIARQVAGLLKDQPLSDRPVARRSDGLFGPHSVAWRVHGDVTSMLIGGIAALLLQMLHPAVLVGVWEHSKFRTDMHGRLRRTAGFIALTTYGGRAEAEAAIERVRRIHNRVRGTLSCGCTYSGNDPTLLAWPGCTLQRPPAFSTRGSGMPSRLCRRPTRTATSQRSHKSRQPWVPLRCPAPARMQGF